MDKGDNSNVSRLKGKRGGESIPFLDVNSNEGCAISTAVRILASVRPVHVLRHKPLLCLLVFLSNLASVRPVHVLRHKPLLCLLVFLSNLERSEGLAALDQYES